MKYIMVALLLVILSTNSYASFYKSYKSDYKVISNFESDVEEQRIRKLEVIMDHLILKIKQIRKQQERDILHPNPPYYIPVMKVK